MSLDNRTANQLTSQLPCVKLLTWRLREGKSLGSCESRLAKAEQIFLE